MEEKTLQDRVDESLLKIADMLDKYKVTDEDFNEHTQLIAEIISHVAQEYESSGAKEHVYIPLKCSKCNKPIWMDTYIQNDGMCIDCNWDMKGYIKTTKEDGYKHPIINIEEIMKNV